MTKHNILRVLSLSLFATLGACDTGDDSAQALRDKLIQGLDQAAVPLATAIATAETEGAGVAIEAELEVEYGALVYRVDVIGNGNETRIDIDPESGAVVRSKAEGSADDDDLQDAALATGADWAALIATAEAHVGGEAFEIEVEGDDGAAFEVKVLADNTIWEVYLSGAGAVVKSERGDDYDGDDDGGYDDDDDSDSDSGDDDSDSDDTDDSDDDSDSSDDDGDSSDDD
jgi:uncharacterized membrane protein YkoI